MKDNCEVCEHRSYLFDDLDPAEWSLLNNSRKEVAYKKGSIIYREGDPIENFIYLIKGLLKVFRTVGDRKEQIIGITDPMDFIGLLNIFSKSTYIYSVATIEYSELCIIDIETIRKIVKMNGRFALTLLEKMSLMNDRLLETRLSINLKNLRGRTAYIILLFARDIYKSNRFELPVSRKEIAELIDMRTENVIRILSEFRRDGIIKIEGKNIEIADLQRLVRISEFG